MAKINYKRLRKFVIGGTLTPDQQQRLIEADEAEEALMEEQAVYEEYKKRRLPEIEAEDATIQAPDISAANNNLNPFGVAVNTLQQSEYKQSKVAAKLSAATEAMNAAGGNGTADGSVGSLVNNLTKGNWMAAGADALVGGMKAVDQLTMGDKNFDAQSQAIDSAVHGISGALMKSGNPWGLLAGAGLETMNFATKAFGQTTEGFDVDISSGGYGNMGHMASKSNRDFGAAIGLGGLDTAKLDRQLQERNEAAQMALQASRISDDQKLEQEARMNTVNETLMKNKIALAGGIDTTTLGA